MLSPWALLGLQFPVVQLLDFLQLQPGPSLTSQLLSSSVSWDLGHAELSPWAHFHMCICALATPTAMLTDPELCFGEPCL